MKLLDVLNTRHLNVANVGRDKEVIEIVSYAISMSSCRCIQTSHHSDETFRCLYTLCSCAHKDLLKIDITSSYEILSQIDHVISIILLDVCIHPHLCQVDDRRAQSALCTFMCSILETQLSPDKGRAELLLF